MTGSRRITLPETKAAFILWSNNYTEGWSPYPCDTLDDCLRTITNYAISEYVITRPIEVTLTERTGECQ